MNSNYEINRHLANERVESRLRDADAHRQARLAKGDRSHGSSGGIVLSAVAFAGRLVSRLLARAAYGRHERDTAPGPIVASK